MNELALFAGAGGGLLATKCLLGWRTVCYVENAKYPAKVLRARIQDEVLDDAPIWDDAKTFDGKPWRGCVDIITAGFPCQPFSVAGKQLADGDSRNMWPDTVRIIREVQPRFAFLENVPGLLSKSHGYFGQILGDLAESGYDARWRVLSAAELGAPHKRDRLFIVACTRGNGCHGDDRVQVNAGKGWLAAQPNTRGGGETLGHTNSERESQQKRIVANERRWTSNPSALLPNTHYQRRQTNQQGQQSKGVWPSIVRGGWWQSEPELGRMVDGLAHRVDRLRAIGNGQVPAVVAAVWGLLTNE